MKQQELLRTQTGAEENQSKESSPSNQPLYERYQIPSSPLWIVGNKEQGYNITMGKYKITQTELREDWLTTATAWMKEEEYNREAKIIHAAEVWLTMHQWDVVLTIALCAITDINGQKDTNK